LNPSQTTKLRHLTLLTLCATHTSSSLPYSYLQRSLSLATDTPTSTALESLATAAITAGLIHAKLSPRTSTLVVSSVAPLRDLRPDSISTLAAVLGDWEARCADVVSGIEAEIQKVRQDAEDRARRKRERQGRVDYAIMLDVATEEAKTNGLASAAGKDAQGGMMDWMSQSGAVKKKRDFPSVDGGDDEDEGVEDLGDGSVKMMGEVVDLSGGMDVDEPTAVDEKGKGKGSAGGGGRPKQRAGGKRGRDS
jgi:COP9 signalosome complex subunit 7